MEPDQNTNQNGNANPFPEMLTGLIGPSNEEQTTKASPTLPTEGQSQSRAWPISVLTIVRTMIFEILGLILAGASLSGLVVLLLKRQGTEPPFWSLGLLGNLTLNTIVSIVSTVFGTTLMVAVSQNISQLCWLRYQKTRSLQEICYYDSASRGATGCISLLWHSPFTSSVGLGAIITLLALALDSFFQQSVGYSYVTIEDTSQRALSVTANTYGVDNVAEYRADSANDAHYKLPYNIKAAMYSGLLSSDITASPKPPFNCPTGSCTWEPFNTLSVSSKCVDLTSKLNPSCSVMDSTYHDSCYFYSARDPALQDMLQYANPTKIFIVNSKSAEGLLQYEWNNAAIPLTPYANFTGFLTMVQWVKASETNGQVYQKFNPKSIYEAGRCFFYLSVNKISVEVFDGIYSEKTLEETTQAENRPSAPTYISNSVKFYIRNESEANYISDPIVYRPAINTGDTNGTFVVPYSTYRMLISQLTLDGFINGSIRSALDGLVIDGKTNMNSMLYQSRNITAAMHNMAAYMTTAMRANDSIILQQSRNDSFLIAPTQAVAGKVLFEQQVVTVRWGWLSLPALLLVLAVTLFLATFLKTRKCRAALWGASPLALFFHGQLRNGPQSVNLNHDTLDTEKDMEKVTSGLCAKLAPNTGSGRITMEVWECT
ncbi:hypothetical protein BELL_0139g00090 [Botrytis elliptica]|uniref:Uncharacterized protein n=1 Tax=Botrytis elliptica TaxID=278938 RepID=A0A4Z1JTZ9_9HELO|nr:hypothetical protein EAE99_003822 [Botrytis elliptica]TGO76744.1 hypothetical protein BELL_0139g00090 [Botrytis elliptica]